MNRNNNNKPLHLNLHRKWFDMILSGEKKEEYRNPCSIYWIKRLCTYAWLDKIEEQKKKLSAGEEPEMLSPEYKNFETIIFSNGYAKDRDQFEIELTGIKCSSDTREEWGAVEDRAYFILSLGKILWKKLKSVKVD